MKPRATIILAMDELSNTTKQEIIKLLFPDLRYGGDPDIERYFEFRKAGRLGQALAIYNGALRVRYADDASRIAMLKLYRENDPRYAAYQEGLLLEFAGKLSLRIRRNIDLITAPLEKADLSDALRALKAVESVLSRLPGETDSALALLSRYEQFARVLGHRQTLARRALELVREYDAVSRSDSPADYDFVARSAAIEERRRSSSSASSRVSYGEREESYDFVSRSEDLEAKRKSAERRAPNYFDPNRIKFSNADKARVEISSALKRREDKVLAFCAKYWPLARDVAFERMVFLYSRKFSGKHFEIFRAIKIGRLRGATDDEILNSVAAILTTSYNYSVSGDLYMQVMWRRIRARMEAQALAERLAAPGPVSRVRARHAAYAAESSPDAKGLDVPATIAPPAAGDEAPTRFTRRPSEHAVPPTFAVKEASARSRANEAARSAPPIPRSENESKKNERMARRAGKDSAERPRSSPAPHEDGRVPRSASRATEQQHATGKSRQRSAVAEPKPAPAPVLRPAAKSKGTSLLNRSPVGPEPVREIRARRGSISDSIRKLSGRTYDVYKVIFLEKVRDHIHKVLLASQTKSHGIFDTAANDAEDQVFGFITAHYDDPFMDWEHSAEREVVESLGFSMPSLAPVIESCFRKL
jgi:hypothetical protein